jgi:hypothetical protein
MLRLKTAGKLSGDVLVGIDGGDDGRLVLVVDLLNMLLADVAAADQDHSVRVLHQAHPLSVGKSSRDR